MLKKSISLLLSLLCLIGLVVITPISVSAETVSGNAGENIYWSIDTESGEMNITGSGNMNDSYTEWQYTPYSVKYRNYVTKASVQEGITSIGNNAFCCFEKMQEVSIPSTVTKIGYYAFNNLFIIESISAPSVTFVDNHAFYNCYKLKNIDLGQRLTQLNAYAFGNCTSMEQIYLPKTLTTVERYAFTNCSSLKDVYYGGSEEEWNSISIAYGNDSLLNACMHYNSNGNSNSDDCYSSKYGWRFSNSMNAFGYESGYRLSWKTYYSVYNVNLASLLVSGIRHIPIEYTEHGGNCFGMSLLSLANYYGLVNLKNYFNKNGQFLYDYGYERIATNNSGEQYYSIQGNQSAIDLIERAQISQESVEFSRCEVYKNDNNFSQLIDFLNSSSAEPLLVIFNKGQGKSHAVVITNDYKPKSESGWFRLPVYNPNTPYNDKLTDSSDEVSYLLVNPETSRWRFFCNGKVEYSGYKSFGNTIRYYSVNNLNPEFFTNTLNLWYKRIQLQFGGKNTTIKDKNNNTLLMINNGTIEHVDNNCECHSMINESNNQNDSTNCYAFYTDEELLYIESDNQEIIGVSNNYAIKSVALNHINTSFDFSQGKITATNNDVYSIAIQDLNQNKTILVEGSPTNNEYISIEFDSNGNGLVKSDISDIDIELDGIEEENVKIEKVIAQNGITGDCTWTLDDNGVLTISGNGAMGDYYTNKGTPWGTSICKVIINSGVTNIGMGAFYDCSNLDCVIIPDSVTSIGNASFKHCTKLERVIIPKNVVSIGSSSFSECTGLLSVSFPDNLSIIDSFAFSSCTKLSDVVIPDSVKNIGEYAFYGCGMTSIDIPDGISNIECGTFAGCNMLTAVELPESVVRINDYAFNCCISLTDIEFPNNLISIGEGAFYACLKMENFDIPDSVTGIGESAFGMCTSLSEVRLPKGLLCVSNSCFYHCENLASVIIPEGVISIEDWAFSECFNLTHITIPNSVTSIGDNVFNGCDNLTIRGYQDTYVQTYAKKHCIPFIKITCIGDTNFDGRITISDVTYIQRYLAEMVVFNNLQLTIADVNSDGKVDINDATHLQKYLAEFDGIVLGKQN